ncbi:protein tyrosine phosphatase [Neisseria meningitidis]|uniref:hypothetical protein n=1 Tax=Neisseria meningitidis TaxID=487 RepID=UPI00027CBE26|nr:hypothetical protein [Neisseria meningitidis]EJU67152.1 protein tyrosine phosphatase, non-receptor type 4 [Neisseria meningitidis 98008]MBG8585316.1 protein tyrosine phosphatase [Neisseria meningitidis]MBG8586549.1 protein tyrosine phosphatase [Neisseria meningitidis]MBG8591900.1 protein tyrosine phosphatase [Neisseria meningitidis]MBG8599842.1 protein tyrosine phosphatase [Neisseria meningitidis]
MIEFVRAKKRLLWAFVLLLVWTCGYRYAADKAEAEQTALIATYRHSSMVAAEQYALQLKKTQDERQRWYDFSQKQGRKPVKKQYPPQTKKAGYLKTKEELLAELACLKAEMVALKKPDALIHGKEMRQKERNSSQG